MSTTRVASMLSAVALVTTGCGTAAGGSATGRVHTVYTYSCCRAADLTPAHPGERLLLHWSVTSSRPPRPQGAQRVTLSARLSGPFSSVTSLKRKAGHVATAVAVTAQTLHTTDSAGRREVSVLRIPHDAGPGLYELDTGTRWRGGLAQSGGTIIRIRR